MEINVVFLGDPCPGKTQLISVCCGSKFEKKSPATTGFYSIKKYIDINKITYTLLLWDNCGREKFRSMNKILLKNSNFFILVYDITEKDTYNGICYWYDEILATGKDAIIGVVGTKSDLYKYQTVDTKIAKKFADTIGAKFIEVSAKENIEPFNIMLKELTKDYIKKYMRKDNENQDNNSQKSLKEFTKNTLLKFYKY